jgi:hypothetical protein
MTVLKAVKRDYEDRTDTKTYSGAGDQSALNMETDFRSSVAACSLAFSRQIAIFNGSSSSSSRAHVFCATSRANTALRYATAMIKNDH